MRMIVLNINDVFLSSISEVDPEHFNLIKESPDFVLLLFELVSNINVDYEISEEIIKKSRSLKSAYKSIPREVVWEYWSSWAFSDKPANGLTFLKQVGWLDLYPELFGTVNVSQNPATHPEGDVFNHLCLSVNEAAEISKREDLNYKDTLLLVFGSLCHDIGKQIELKGHEIHGVDIASRFLTRIGIADNLIPEICKIVQYHMADYIIDGKIVENGSITKSFIKKLQNLINPVPLDVLILVHEADKSGRFNVSYTNRLSENFKLIRSIYYKNSFKFDYTAYSKLIKKRVIPYPMTFKGLHRKLFLDRVNKCIKEGYLKKDELTTVLSYLFRKSYRDAVIYVDSLGYRDTATLVQYVNDNNISLDDLLLLGESGIKKILNHSEL
jgi:hypothetical protein